MDLRPYQLKVIEAVNAGWRAGHRKQLAVVPTGGGKTIIFSHIAKQLFPRRTLILAHREELIDQAIDKLKAATGMQAEKEKADDWATKDAAIVVGSIQTLMRRFNRWDPAHFELLVVDEAHHAISASWRKVLEHFDGYARVLGVTATPDRGDKRNLGEYFEHVATEIGLFDLINDGYLSRIVVKAVPLAIDLSNVRTTAGDFSEADLGDALEPYLDQIAASIKEHASFRRVLAFLPLIATSEKFVDACRRVGLVAEHVCGISPDRKEKLQEFARGDYDLLSNAMLLTEGYDDVGIDCIVVLRPTKSRPLYAQMVGRGTRVHHTKENLLLLDFLWMHETHSIVRPAHLIAKNQEEADDITRIADAATGKGEQDLEVMATSAQAEREASLRRRLKEQSRKKGRTISAEEFAMMHEAVEVADYEPVMKWESQPITEKQAGVLKRAGIDLESVSGKGHASKLIDIIFANQKLTLASQAQRSTMRRLGYPSADTATADEARKFFAELKSGAVRYEGGGGVMV